MGGDCYVELKSLTLSLGGGCGAFPDANSERALAHALALRRVLTFPEGAPAKMSAGRDPEAASGRRRALPRRRAVLVFCVMHNGVRVATTADGVQPAYGRQVRAAVADGVEVLAWRCAVSPRGLCLNGPLPFVSPWA